MKYTLVTDHQGALVGTIQGHDLTVKKDGMEAGLMVSPGYTLHHVEVDDSYAQIADAAELHQKLGTQIPQRP